MNRNPTSGHLKDDPNRTSGHPESSKGSGKQERQVYTHPAKGPESDPKWPAKALRRNYTFKAFHAANGLSGNDREQRGFSKVRVFVQPLSSEQFSSSAERDKITCQNQYNDPTDFDTLFEPKTTPQHNIPKRKMMQTDARNA